MTQDANRNRAYEAAIRHQVQCGNLRWFEIGPGRDALLTRMVLTSPLNPRKPQQPSRNPPDQDHRLTTTTITSVEGNPTSAAAARKALTMIPDHRKRARIISGLSTEQRVIEEIGPAKFDGFVQELLG